MRRTVLRACAAAAVVAAALVVHGLLRVSAASFDDRRGELLHVELEDRTVAAGRLVERFTLESTSGLRVALAVERPALAKAPLPTVVILAGYKVGRDVIDVIEDHRDVATVALSYPYEGKYRLEGLEVLTGLPSIQRAILDTPPAMLLAMDFLRALPWVDRTRIELVGVSFGSTFACIAGAVDTRYRRVWVVHGGGAPFKLLRRQLRASDAPPLLADVGAAGLTLLLYGVPLAPEKWIGRIAPRPIVMIDSLEDGLFPRECADALYDSAAMPKERIWLGGGHVNTQATDVIRDILQILYAHVCEPALPVASQAAEAPAGSPSGAALAR